jgi:hypothetical protein
MEIQDLDKMLSWNFITGDEMNLKSRQKCITSLLQDQQEARLPVGLTTSRSENLFFYDTEAKQKSPVLAILQPGISHDTRMSLAQDYARSQDSLDAELKKIQNTAALRKLVFEPAFQTYKL